MALGIALTVIIVSVVALVLDSVSGGQRADDRDRKDESVPEWDRQGVMTELKVLRGSLTAGRPRASRIAALVLATTGILLMVGGFATLSMGDDPWTGMIQFFGVMYVAAPALLMFVAAFLIWRRVDRMTARRRLLERYLEDRGWS